MTKQICIVLTEQANTVVSKYMEKMNTNRNKAINELIIRNIDTPLKTRVTKLTKEVEELRKELNKNSTLLQDIYNILQK